MRVQQPSGKPGRHPNETAFSSLSCQPSFIIQISKWLDACNSSHGDTCVAKSIPERQPEDVPLWLIDTHQQCIVSGLSAHCYLALSYVWPETRDASTPTPRTLILDGANMAGLQDPGSLSSEIIATSIPAVIRHAMEVTIALGERYLWVDRLCILQNDNGTLSEVAKMDQVYAGAYLTIIAAAPDVMYQDGMVSKWPSFKSMDPSHRFRFPGIEYEGEIDFANPSPELFELTKGEPIRTMSRRYGVLDSSRWSTRGWTYQEQMLCKRAAVFTEEGVFWDCQCCMWDGVDLLPGHSMKGIPLHANLGTRFSTRCWPDFGFYVDLICPYNGREFSYPQDALLGFSGVLNALIKSFPRGFICGIPKIFLNHVLLWQPVGIAERRMDRREDINTIDASEAISSLPSWAWCGWQCLVDPWSLRSGLAFLDDPTYQWRVLSWRTTNSMDWCIASEHDQLEPVLEPNTFDQHVGMRLTADAPLPDGWARHEISQTELYFTHEADKNVRFKHPIPLREEPGQPDLCFSSHLILNTTGTIFFPATVFKSYKATRSESITLGPSKVSVVEDETFLRGPDATKCCPILVLQQPNHAFAGLC